MLIGITGGIGSGKSTICRRLRTLGYAVYDTDSEAQRIIVEDPEVRDRLTLLLGPDTYVDGEYNRAYVAERVFHDASLRAKVNAIVHPAVRRDVQAWAKRKRKMCFVESAILFESHFDTICDKTVLVTAPIELRFTRVIMRDHTSAEALQQRIKAQMSDRQRAKLANFIIDNDGSHLVSVLVDQLLAQLQASA